MPNGKIQEEHIESLKKIGSWVKVNGETIYKSKRGPINPSDEVASTQINNIIYIHLLNEKKIKYLLEGFTTKFRKISYFKSNKKVSYKQNNEGMILFLDKKEVNPINTIIKIEL